MDIYKLGLEKKVRFQTANGSLTIEQLMDLKLATIKSGKKCTPLADVVRDLAKELDDSGDNEKLSFLEVGSKPVNKLAKLRFDIAKDIYLTKLEQSKSETLKAINKKHNDELDELISQKLHDDKKNLSIEELRNLKR